MHYSTPDREDKELMRINHRINKNHANKQTPEFKAVLSLHVDSVFVFKIQTLSCKSGLLFALLTALLMISL